MWAQAEGRNPKLPPPGALKSRTMVPSYCEISVADALIWAMSGVFTEEERQALGSAEQPLGLYATYRPACGVTA